MQRIMLICCISLLSACHYDLNKQVPEYRQVLVACPVPNKNTWFLEKDSIDVTHTRCQN